MHTDCTDFVVGSILSPLTVTDVALDGGAVARHEGRVVFLDRGLPGELVSATVTAIKKKIIEATVTATLAPSVHAVDPWCPHAADCGGCTWQHFTFPALLEWKRKHIEETLRRIGNVSLSLPPLVPCPTERGYRNKMAYAFGLGEQGLALGLRKRASREVLEVTQCGMQPEPAMRLLELVRNLSKDLKLAAWTGKEGILRFLVVHTPKYQLDSVPQCLVECITSPAGAKGAKADKIRQLGQGIMDSGLGITGFTHTVRFHPADIAQGEKSVLSLGNSELHEQYNHLLLLSPGSAFMQTNTAVASLLYQQVAASADLSGTEVVWDLYCGVGGIGLYLAAKAGAVYGVDIQREAVTFAQQNATALGYEHCRYSIATLEASLTLPQPDCIIIDPPRAGLQAEALALLANTKAKKLLYVSCDVATQARDLKELAPFWKPEQAFAFDMFPYTPHAETLVVLRPAL